MVSINNSMLVKCFSPWLGSGADCPGMLCCISLQRFTEHSGASSDLTLLSEGGWTKNLLRFCMLAIELDKDCLCFKKLDVA